MSDLSPNERPSSPPLARRRRPKTKASTPHRSARPAALSTSAQSAAESTPAQEKATAAGKLPQTTPTAAEDKRDPEAALVSSEPEVTAAPEDRFTWKVRGWTLFSKQILLWGGIAGIANIVFSFAAILIFNTFDRTKADATSNAGLLDATLCLSFLVPPALAFFAGLRVTARAGSGRDGAVAGLWSLLVLEIVALIYSLIALGVSNQLQSFDGGSFLANLFFDGLVAFGAGWVGGWYNARKRRRAEQAQELLTSSS